VKDHITYEQFVEKVQKIHNSHNGVWRYGQSYFNVLSSVRSDIAEAIRGTLHDPFHKDKILQETETFVKSLW